jgi:dsRNA-specific ribonuclease
MSQKNVLNDDDIVKDNQTDDLVFNPYNPLNVKVKDSDIKTILKTYGLPPLIHNIELYKRAFIHRSYTKRPHLENIKQKITIMPKPDDCMPLHTKSNERLEFLGDGVLELATKYYLYRRFPKENEGFMTEKKIALVKNEAIGKLALEMGLHKWYIISKHAEEKKIRHNLKKLGCLFESFIGALFLDMNKITVKDEENWFSNVFVTGPGFQMVQKFIENIFEKHINWIELIQQDNNYKNLLQVSLQKEFKITPEYVELNYDAEEGYHMGVYLCLGTLLHEVDIKDAISYKNLGSYEAIHKYIESHGKILVFMGSGKHKIKKKAEQLACEEAILTK